MNFMDIIFVGILLFCIISGFAKGLVRSFSGFFSFIVGLILAVVCSSKITEYLCVEWNLAEKISPFFYNFVKQPMEPANQVISVSRFKEMLAQINTPDFLSDFINSLPLDEVFSQSAAVLFIELLVFIAIIILSMIVIKFILNRILFSMAPTVFKTIDRFSGSLFGCLKGVFILALIIVLAAPFNSIIEFFGIESTFWTLFSSEMTTSLIAAKMTALLELFGIL